MTVPVVPGPDDDPEQPDDTACWLHLLCPECGAMPTPEVPDRCWRCGTPRRDSALPGQPGGELRA
jgi:hypothetical protein